jgi:hypothetical protein
LHAKQAAIAITDHIHRLSQPLEDFGFGETGDIDWDIFALNKSNLDGIEDPFREPI